MGIQRFGSAGEGIVRLVSPSPTISHTRLPSASLRHSIEAAAGAVNSNPMVQAGMRSEFPLQEDFVHLDKSKFVEGRVTNHNNAEGTTSASKSTSREDSAPEKFPAFSIDYPQPKENVARPKEKAGECIVQRGDGQWVRLVCPKCHKGNFLSAHGFISHCRTVHKIKLRTTNEAAVTYGKPIEVGEIGGVETTTCPSKLPKHGDLGQPDLLLPNHAVDAPILISDDEPDDSTIRVNTGSRGDTEVQQVESIPRPRQKFTIKIHKRPAVTSQQPVEIDEVGGIETTDEPAISTIRANAGPRRDSEPQPAKLSSGLKRNYTVLVEIPARKRSCFGPTPWPKPPV
ncbi:hypothetical protein BDZ45DRAFT_460100 [Acephala macrosclerotiorum]|nr:hypothetical protein BDZ45DRAFT_460100 [Acephala macrosclerotiorum]